MCMGGCGGGKSSAKSSGNYTPKKFSGQKATPKARGGFSASGKGGSIGNFGQPKVRFSGRGR